jgi:acyl carrier protein
MAITQKVTLELIQEILSEQLGVDPKEVTVNSSIIEDLGADSLDAVELMIACEEKFDVEIPDDEAEKIRTVGDLLEYLQASVK